MRDASRSDRFLDKLKAQENLLRESWIRAMEARIVRDNLQKCYRVEGVNNIESCKHLADRYTQMLKENRVSHALHVSPRLTLRMFAGSGLQAHRYIEQPWT